jgi:MerR family redox-sensitive transcriptional activator SoxR
LKSRSIVAKTFSIGEVARRTGVATSALRFYETKGLIASERTDGNQRRYAPSVLRVVSVIRAAQEVGITLAEVGEALDRLPHDHAPTAEEWAGMASAWQAGLDERIRLLTALRDELDSCIGCGCLSLETCAIFNPDDRARVGGSGGRYLYGDPRPT